MDTYTAEVWPTLFHYDGTTGDLIWKARPASHFKNLQAWSCFSSTKEGRKAGYKGERNIQVRISGGFHYAHNIVWEMHNGPVPEGMEIDHKDGNGTNNRLSNLRLSTHAENMRNRRKNKGNRSGFKGVSLHSSGLWRSRIAVDGKTTLLGYYDTPEEAHAAYAHAAPIHHGEFSCTE